METLSDFCFCVPLSARCVLPQPASAPYDNVTANTILAILFFIILTLSFLRHTVQSGITEMCFCLWVRVYMAFCTFSKQKREIVYTFLPYFILILYDY